MFPQQGRRQPVHDRGRREPNRVGDTAHHIERGVLDLHDQSSRQRLRIVHRLAGRLDRGCRNILRREPLEPFGCRSLIEDRAQRRDKHLAMLGPQGIRLKARVGPQRVRRLQHTEKAQPQCIRTHGSDKMAPVSAAKHLVRNNAGVRVPPALRRFPGIQVIAARIDEQRQLRIEQRHVERLSRRRSSPAPATRP